MRTSTNPVLFTAMCVAFVTSGVCAGDEKANGTAWLPPITVFRADRHDSRRDIRVPPSMFPDLVITPTEWDKKEDTEAFRTRRDVSFDKLCPHLRGKAVLKIEPTDDALRKLLKARLHQLILEYLENQRPFDFAGPDPRTPERNGSRFLEMQSVLTELWDGQPKELAPWLAELVVASKELERYTRLRVEAGALRPQEMPFATRVRLQLELALWTAKNSGTKPIKKQPVGKGEKELPAEGDWLADKKVPPTLFPDIVPPASVASLWDGSWGSFVFARRMARYSDRCPRLFGVVALKIEPADDTARKLLKTRLHQGTVQFRLTDWKQGGIGPDPNALILDVGCVLDIQAAATELWAEQPKELVPWLEELLVAAKDQEEHTRLHVEAGARWPQFLNYATQVRLKIEAELWKAKNAK